MLLSAIVAVSENGVIGRDGHLPWHLSQDLKRFKAITTGHSIVLGRKNYDDIGRPLPNRVNYVLSRNEKFEAPGCIVCTSLEQALEKARLAGETECFIIGGANVYEQAMPLVQKLYVTRVLAQVDGDVHLNDLCDGFKLLSEEQCFADEKNDYDTLFQIWMRD
ncbi:MAG: dihydrofolate reductase [Fibrobacter sp.]|nr:dihydrofolate reductase [Fibrobacter sp.]